eukprot:4299726-Heterocapsa_arctica.AAC.1
MRAENGQTEPKGIGLVTHIHPFCTSWSYQFGARLVDRTSYMWIEHHTNRIVRDKFDAKLFGPYEGKHSLRRNLLMMQGCSASAVGFACSNFGNM